MHYSKINFPYLLNIPRSKKRRSVVASGHSSIGTIMTGNQIAKVKPPPTQAKSKI